MAAGDFTFDIALGREVEFYRRVDGNDPSTSGLVVVVLAAVGLGDDADLKVCETLADVLAIADEVTNTGYARKVLTDADLAAITVDHTRSRCVPAIPIQSWATPAAGDTWAKALVCYDPDTTGGTDSAIVPITAHAMRYQGAYVIPNGSQINLDLSSGFCMAQ